MEIQVHRWLLFFLFKFCFFHLQYVSLLPKYTLLLSYWKLYLRKRSHYYRYVPYFWINLLFQFQEPECIYQCKLPDLPNQFNFENCKTRMLLVVFVWRTKYGRFSRLPPETLSTKSYWCLTHVKKSTRVSTFCFFRSIYLIICFLSKKKLCIFIYKFAQIFTMMGLKIICIAHVHTSWESNTLD